HVYYCTDQTCQHEGAATKTQENKIARLASQSPLVKSVDFISKEEALKIERKKRPQLYSFVPTNPLPDALKITPKRGEDIARVAALFQQDPTTGIQGVDYGKKTTHKVLRLAHVIEIIFIIAVLLLLLASPLLLANT